MNIKSIAWSIGGLVVLVGFVLLLGMVRAPSTPIEVGTASPVLNLVSDDYTKGAVGGKVVVVEYLDFECPACGAYYPIVKQLSEEFANEVTFSVRYFPLAGHKNGMASALAVEAAGRQGKFWEMHNLLFDRQKEWGGKQSPTPEAFAKYAQELGLNMQTYATDVESQEVKDRVQRNLTEAGTLKLGGTPSFFVQNKKIQSPASLEAFRALIQAEVDATK